MKNYLISITIIAMGLFYFTACGSGGSDKSLGKWEIVEATGPYADMNIGTVYDFKDTTLTMSKGLVVTEANYKISGDTIIQTIGNISMKFLYKIDGDKMTYQTLGTDQIFTMKKK